MAEMENRMGRNIGEVKNEDKSLADALAILKDEKYALPFAGDFPKLLEKALLLTTTNNQAFGDRILSEAENFFSGQSLSASNQNDDDKDTIRKRRYEAKNLDSLRCSCSVSLEHLDSCWERRNER